MQETYEMGVQSLGQEDSLEEGMATHYSTFAWRIPWSEEPGRLQSLVSLRVGHDWSDLAHTHVCTYVCMYTYICAYMCVHKSYIYIYELPNVQAGFRKGRRTRDQIANICWIIEKAREFQKQTSISALLTMPKPLTVWITINCGKFWKRWEYQTTWLASWEISMQIRKQQLELDMEQQTGSK